MRLCAGAEHTIGPLLGAAQRRARRHHPKGLTGRQPDVSMGQLGNNEDWRGVLQAVPKTASSSHTGGTGTRLQVSSFLLVEAASAMAQRSAATCVPTSFRGTEQLVTQKCVCFLKESRKTPGKGVCRELGHNSPCPRAQDHQITPTITYSPPITPMNAAFLHAQSLFTALTPF